MPWFCGLWGACILPWFGFHLTRAGLWKGFLFLLVSHRHVSLSLAYKRTGELSDEQQDSSKLDGGNDGGGVTGIDIAQAYM